MTTPDKAQAGDLLPVRKHVCDEVQLFFYNAVLWNAHRIHYDLPYARDVEGYPGLVVAGPLMGDWLAQVVDEWIEGFAAELVAIEYSNRQAAYVGDELTAGGEVVTVEDGQIVVDLFVKNAAGEVITPGQATIRLGD
ncbi:MAG: hypothetical protein AAF993_10655 [Pseudomonadota bacterium]